MPATHRGSVRPTIIGSVPQQPPNISVKTGHLDFSETTLHSSALCLCFTPRLWSLLAFDDYDLRPPSTMPTFSLASAGSTTSRSSSHASSSASLNSTHSSAFWRPANDYSDLSNGGHPDEKSNPSIWNPSRYVSSKSNLYQSRRSIAVVVILLCALFVWIAPPPSEWGRRSGSFSLPLSPVRPAVPTQNAKPGPDPAKWLAENSNDIHAVTGPGFTKLMQSSKPRAALISLVRNQEIDGIIQSMTQLEYHWNHKYQYPWIFFNDEPFNDEFKVGESCVIVP